MADWIRMRGSLLTNTKVTRMARVLLADPEFRAWYGNAEVTNDMSHGVTRRHVTVVTRVTVGGLLAVWSSVNESAGRDGHLRHASLFEVDEMAGIPGFGAAMEAVDWLTQLPENKGLEFANFTEHNTVGQERSTLAKTAAERAKEYRERKASRDAANVTNGVTKNSDASRDTVTTEKNREEKNKEPIGSTPSDKPTRKTRGTKRVPDDFAVTSDMESWVAENAPRIDWRRETEKFRDWEFQHARTDWPATWRTWMRKAQDMSAQGRVGRPQPVQTDWTGSAL